VKLLLTTTDMDTLATAAHTKGKTVKVPTDVLAKLMVDHSATLARLSSLGEKGVQG
jgi:hypothetical protein